MTDKQLTPNFKLSEFIKTDPTPYQESLLQLLADNLQKVRDMLQQYAVEGKKVSIGISSGVRTAEDYDRLKAKGYNPSKTSDHLCGLQLTAKPTLGAADIYVTNCKLSMKEIFTKIMYWDKTLQVHFGQVIYEYNPATKAEWIHLGNDWNQIFHVGINVSRTKYMQSLDNGKSYQAVK